MAQEIEEKEVKKKKKRHDPRGAMIRIIALIMAISMVFAVAATCIFYIQYLF